MTVRDSAFETNNVLTPELATASMGTYPDIIAPAWVPTLRSSPPHGYLPSDHHPRILTPALATASMGTKLKL